VQGKKELLSRVLHRGRLFPAFGALRRDLCVIYGYHRIVRDRADGCAFADDVCGQTVSELEASLVWLKENTAILSEPELIRCIERGRGPGKLSTLITFDDGYADNYTLALPILKKHAIPAVFFVPSNMIEERTLGWWDLISWTVKRSAKPSLVWEGKTFNFPADKTEAISFFHKKMQLEKQSATNSLVAELAEKCGVALPAKDVRDRELMTWDQLREAANSGITVASHTHTHLVLATIDEAAQREELATSKAFIEEKTRMPVRSIAYPVGGYRHFTEATRKIAHDVGYQLGYSFCTGTNRWGSIAPFDVKRIGPPNAPEMIAGTTVLPEVFDWQTDHGVYGG
jgi:peptidoglycan/xylan/chitin deacetylase (PgdA/CDA1 family)